MQPTTVNDFVSTLSANSSNDTLTRLEVAISCRNSSLDASECAPTLYNFGTDRPNANDLAVVLQVAWGGILTPQLLTNALSAVPAYAQPDIAAAVANQYKLNFLTNYMPPKTPNTLGAIALYQGNLTTLSAGEAVTYLIISCLPGDYSPTPGSMIAALASIGVNVGSLAQNKAADFLATNHCWVSQAITGQSFTRLIVLEATGATTVQWIPGIFNALQTFAATQPNSPFTIASAMLSTGSAGADPSQVVTAIFNGANSLISVGATALYSCKIVNFNSAWNTQITNAFNAAKPA